MTKLMVLPKKETDSLHARMLQHLASWASAVGLLHEKMRTDFEFVNGRQASKGTEMKLSSEGRELLYFNEIRPQLELLSGHRTSQQFDYVTSPRGREDKRLSAIASILLKATYDVIKKNEVVRRVGDDGDIGGLGAVYMGHTFDDAVDVVWGDLFMQRISPFSFVWDAWGTSPHYQDGQFMGHRWWMSEKAFRKAYPDAEATPASNDWFQALGQQFGSGESLLPPEALRREMVNADTGHLAVFRLYYREPRTVYYVADDETGELYEGGATKEQAEAAMQRALDQKVAHKLGELRVVPQNLDDTQIGFFILNQENQPMAGPDGQAPLVFATDEEAQAAITAKEAELRAVLQVGWKVFPRKATQIRWVEMNAFEILGKGTVPVTTRTYPYRAFISRHLGDEVEDIEGIVRQIVDRQKEITKRYNHLASHLAHAAHSGFFNKKGEGADTRQLERMGTRPGVVVEYLTVQPEKIEPSSVPIGHFNLLDANVGGIQRSTGINAEMLGLTSSSTVSGDAIDARQRGGVTMLMGRLLNFQEFDREVAQEMLHQIQTQMPVEKMRRILGVWEAKTQTQITGESVFKHPNTGDPATEDEILDLLASMKTTHFDLVLKPTPVGTEVREQQFMKGLQLMQMITQTGRRIGSVAFKEMAQLSDLPERLIAALEADAQAEQQVAIAEQQQIAIGDSIKSQQAREGPRGS